MSTPTFEDLTDEEVLAKEKSRKHSKLSAEVVTEDGASLRNMPQADKDDLLATTLAENEALRAETLRLEQALDLRNAEYSLLLSKRMATAPVPTLTAGSAMEAGRERARRQQLAMVGKDRLVSLAVRFDGRLKSDLFNLHREDLITIIVAGDRASRARR